MEQADFKKTWKEIVSGFLKLGATAYGGPAVQGLCRLSSKKSVNGYPKNASSKAYP